MSMASWRTETTPVPKEVNPKLVFDRLFGGGAGDESAAARAKRELYRKSILDLVQDDARALQGTLGSADKRKVDEYFTAVRELEQRIDRARQRNQEPPPKPRCSCAKPARSVRLQLLGGASVVREKTGRKYRLAPVFQNRKPPISGGV